MSARQDSVAAASILWRRLDRPGHEAARLLPTHSGWQLTGSAVFAHEGVPCALGYQVVCDAAWHTTSALVTGWIGDRAIDIAIVADSARHWRLNGADLPGVAGCLDIDLAFSPSTNLLPIRRLRLEAGKGMPVRAAWLRFPELTVEPLAQVYRRTDTTTYEYESDGGAFRAILRTNAAGFVTHYPDLWEAEP